MRLGNWNPNVAASTAATTDMLSTRSIRPHTSYFMPCNTFRHRLDCLDFMAHAYACACILYGSILIRQVTNAYKLEPPTSSARHTGFERGLGQGRSTGNAVQFSPRPFHTHVHMFTPTSKTHALTLTARTRTAHSDSLDPSLARNVSTYRTRALAQAPRTTPHEYLYTYIGTYHRHYIPSACFTRLTSRVHEPSQHVPSLNCSPHCYPHLRPHREPKGTGGSACFTRHLYYSHTSLCNPTFPPLCAALKLIHSWREVPLFPTGTYLSYPTHSRVPRPYSAATCSIQPTGNETRYLFLT